MSKNHFLFVTFFCKVGKFVIKPCQNSQNFDAQLRSYSWGYEKSDTDLYIVLFVCFYGRPPEGRKVGIPSFRDFASRPGLVTPPSRH